MGIFKTENSLVGYLIIARNAEVLALWKLYVERQEREFWRVGKRVATDASGAARRSGWKSCRIPSPGEAPGPLKLHEVASGFCLA